MKIFKRDCWYDEHEHLVYFEIIEDGKTLWQSTWTDNRDLFDTQTVDEIRSDCKDALCSYGMNPSLVAGDVSDWGWL